jgi:hypothetical protein
MRQDPDGLTPDVVSAPEAAVSRAEAEDMMGGPGMVATPGMWKGWVSGGLLGTVLGAALAAVVGLIVVATSSASPWWILGAAVIGGFTGGTIGFMLGAPFGTLKYDQGGRRAEDDDGGPITRSPEAMQRERHRGWHRPGGVGTSH